MLFQSNTQVTNLREQGKILDVGSYAYTGLEKMTVSEGYWLGKNGKYYSTNWGGNQWTGARSVAFKVAKVYKVGGTITTVLAGGASIGYGIYQDSQLNGGQFTFGNNAGRATASVAGGVAGGMIGAEIGASIGVWFGGVGAIPGVVIGGVVGSIVGGWGGSTAGEAIYDSFAQ